MSKFTGMVWNICLKYLKRKSAYKRSWLNEWGGWSGFCVEELKGIEEDPRRYWFGMKDDGGCVVHQLGFPAIIGWRRREKKMVNCWDANEEVGNEIFNLLFPYTFGVWGLWYFLVCATKQGFG